MKKPDPLPEFLTPADYARACTAASGVETSREVVRKRIADGTLTTQEIPVVGHKPRAYISTKLHPPGALHKPNGRPPGRRRQPPAPVVG